jgi:hypothetical protein
LELKPNIQLLSRVLSLAAVLFGLVTIIAGTLVLTGSDPGYNVFLPLLIYNTAMGVFYMAAGVTTWRNLSRGKYAAASIFVLNLIVLGIIGYLHMTGTSVAVESVLAMIIRTAIWLMLYLGLTWVCHRKALVGRQHA